MKQYEFAKELLKAAQENKIYPAEVYAINNDKFDAMAAKGEIVQYSKNTTSGLSLRGIYNGKMGYAASNAYDEKAMKQLIEGVKESASLIENEDVEVIFKGSDKYPDFKQEEISNKQLNEREILDLMLEIEKKTMAKDKRIFACQYIATTMVSYSVNILNSYGLNLTNKDSAMLMYLSTIAKEGKRTTTGSSEYIMHDTNDLDIEKLINEAVDEAIFKLKAKPIAGGSYKTIIEREAMTDLLSTFNGIFSADNTQKGLSLYKNKVGEKIAAECVTLIDDPLLKGGFSSSAFDAEGVATYTKNIIENGILSTLLYNLKTAQKDNVKTTANAGKAGYAGTVGVSPSNMYIKPGNHSIEQLQQQICDGLVITELDGLHAGANKISGDFSLLASGYTVKDGKKDKAVEQITLAGNFYQLLLNVLAVGNDIKYPIKEIASPSIYVGNMSVSGNAE